MSKVPPKIANTATKVLLAECILKAAAAGHTSYNELIAAANRSHSDDHDDVLVKTGAVITNG
jgi:hypothetical protein